MRGADEASQPRFGRDGEAKLIPFLFVARWATTGGRCGVLGSRRVKPRREPQQARQVAASGGGRRAKARSVPRSPHACRTLRESTRARRCSAARRVFVEVGNRRNWRGGNCPYSLLCAGLRRLTLRVMRHDPCRTYEDRNLTRSAKGSCVSGKK